MYNRQSQDLYGQTLPYTSSYIIDKKYSDINKYMYYQ